MTDLVSAGAAPQTPSPSPCWYGEEEQQTMEQGQSSCEEQQQPCHAAASCISPIWGQFVDMILEQEEEDQPQQAKHDGRSWSPPPHADTELHFSFLGGPTRVSVAEAAAPKYPVSAPPALTTTSSWKGLVSSSDTLLTPSYHPSPHHHDPYPQHALLWHKKKQPRQRILSPQRVLLEQQQDKEHSGRSPVLTSSPSFVLQDPASLPEALARLRV
uniref:Uncharacterized protein n=1 Tax=Entomoneis paludosa TaxID=265537 RepID=A0A7S2Y9N8_9STRA